MHHFKEVAEKLKEELEKGTFEKLIVGCQESVWPEFEPHLHNYLKQRLLGHFSAEISSITNEQIRDKANRVLQEQLDSRRKELVREVLGEAQRDGLGVTGVRRVLRALEMGEVQTLLVGENFRAHGIECTNCGHLDTRTTSTCEVCGQKTRELEDVSDAIIPTAIHRDIELFYVKNDPELDRVGNIAALLRFRADQNTPSKVSAA
jgi:peptide chain release factor subunit 1